MPKAEAPYTAALRKFQRDYFGMMLQTNGWNVSRVAELAGMDRCSVYRICKVLGLMIPKRQEGRPGLKPRPVKVNGVEYPSVQEAMRRTGWNAQKVYAKNEKNETELAVSA
ncbi:MAG TPA: hypothetical protein VD994_10265 [Prosthecobacter sp.]|nr:hypothetical protein [Prosthecobacter sp.]